MFEARVVRAVSGRRVTAVVELGEYRWCLVLKRQCINAAHVFCRCSVRCFEGPSLERCIDRLPFTFAKHDGVLCMLLDSD